jgi:hypothetical protein
MIVVDSSRREKRKALKKMRAKKNRPKAVQGIP